MSSADSSQKYDFRSHSRAPVQIETQLLDWLSRASRLLSQKWKNLSGVEPDWHFPVPKIEECRKAQLPQFAVVFEVMLDNHSMPTLLVVPGEFGIALVKTTLGESIESMEDQRPVTPIEVALIEMFAVETIDAVSTGGAGAGYPSCRLGNHNSHPDLVRIYPNESKLIALEFESEFPFGKGALRWIWPQSLADDLFFEDHDEAAENAQHTADLQNLAMRMKVNLTVQLGAIHLDIAELAKLSVGDVLTLDQAINEPLDVKMSNQTIMRAWPTRTGSHQSIQVEETRERVTAGS